MMIDGGSLFGPLYSYTKLITPGSECATDRTTLGIVVCKINSLILEHHYYVYYGKKAARYTSIQKHKKHMNTVRT